MRSLERRRDDTLGTLAEHFAAGLVREATLEHRVEQAIRAVSPAALRDVTWDLPPRRHPLWDALRERFERPRPTRIAFRTPAPLDLRLDAGARSYVVGRSSACDLVLRDPAISRRHALVSIRGDRCTIRDLGSTNGLTLNGRPVTTAVVHAGDHLTFGGAVHALAR